jgi:hypothetical protein
MSRQEDFIEAGIAYRMGHGKPMCIAGSKLADVERDLNRVMPFEAGAEHGYQYAIDKACEWLTNYFVNYLQFDKQIISDFRKAMEE